MCARVCGFGCMCCVCICVYITKIDTNTETINRPQNVMTHQHNVFLSNGDSK